MHIFLELASATTKVPSHYIQVCLVLFLQKWRDRGIQRRKEGRKDERREGRKEWREEGGKKDFIDIILRLFERIKHSYGEVTYYSKIVTKLV